MLELPESYTMSHQIEKSLVPLCSEFTFEYFKSLYPENHKKLSAKAFLAAEQRIDETVLNRLINRILIGEPKKVDGVKTQKVRIVYNFVGEL